MRACNRVFMQCACVCVCVCLCLSWVEGWASSVASTIMHPGCQCVPPLSPSRAAQGKTKGFDISHIKGLYLGAECLINSPYFRDSVVTITIVLWLADHS